MKRSIIITMAVLSVAALSCTKDVNNQPAPEKEQVAMSFDATIGTPTKVEIASSETAEGRHFITICNCFIRRNH